MPFPIIYQGQILFRFDKPAMSLDCCCDGLRCPAKSCILFAGVWEVGLDTTLDNVIARLSDTSWLAGFFSGFYTNAGWKVAYVHLSHDESINPDNPAPRSIYFGFVLENCISNDGLPFGTTQDNVAADAQTYWEFNATDVVGVNADVFPCPSDCGMLFAGATEEDYRDSFYVAPQGQSCLGNPSGGPESLVRLGLLFDPSDCPENCT